MISCRESVKSQREPCRRSFYSAQQFSKLRDVRRYASRLVLGKRPGDVGCVFCLSRIDVSERLPVGVNYLEAACNLLDRPWCLGSAALIRLPPSWLRGHGFDLCCESRNCSLIIPDDD
jgi:hypothetical protein